MTQYNVRHDADSPTPWVVYATEFATDRHDLAGFKTPREAIAFSDSLVSGSSENRPGGWDGPLTEASAERSPGASTPDDGGLTPGLPSSGTPELASVAESADALRPSLPVGDGSAVTTRELSLGL